MLLTIDFNESEAPIVADIPSCIPMIHQLNIVVWPDGGGWLAA